MSEPDEGKAAVVGRRGEASMNRHAQPQFWVTSHLASPLLRRLLRSRAGRRLGRRFALVRYRGRRTGRSYGLPVPFVPAEPARSWRPSPDVLAGIGGSARLAAAVITAPAVRHWYNRWGATPAEVAGVMPGDDLVPHPKMSSTRAVTIAAAPAEVWAWLVQVGQDRGGFYSYDVLENLARCDIHSASQIIPRFQRLQPGDLIRLAPGRAPCFRVASAEPPQVLVLAAADPVTQVVQPLATSPDELASTWQWLLRPVDGGHGTRLVARQRYSYPRGQSVRWHMVEPVSFVMERRMLHGIKARAETHARADIAPAGAPV